METAPAPAEVLSTKKIQAAVEQFTRALAAGEASPTRRLPHRPGSQARLAPPVR